MACPVIFISNFAPHSERSFLRRVHCVDALESLEDAPRIKVPKEEVDGEEMEVEVIEVPSSDEDEEMEENFNPSSTSTPVRPQGSKVSPVLEKRILRNAN